MKIILPPKRFEDDKDPKYDPIRPISWFRLLEQRRQKLGLLKCAYHDVRNLKISMTQEGAARHWNVDERELRDYEKFVEGYSRLYHSRLEKFSTKRKEYQAVMDEAYARYCENKASSHIGLFLAEIAPLYGIKRRYAQEIWEIDPLYWPTGYLNDQKAKAN